MCCPAPLSACGNHSGEAERRSGIGLKLFGFIPEPVFTFIPESCSGSSRNTVRNHPGIAFILPRIPHLRMELSKISSCELRNMIELSWRHSVPRCIADRFGNKSGGNKVERYPQPARLGRA